MKNVILSLGISCTLFSCTLSASQEAALNASLSDYVQSRNECQVVGLVGFTYPGLVEQYKSVSDSVFLAKFNCDENVEYAFKIKNPTLRKISSEKAQIQVLYDFDHEAATDSVEINEFQLVAISENNGKNWFFISWEDYANDTLCPNLKRLFETN